MKVISVWQPYASLIVHGFKFVETRGWPAPKSIVGSRIAIASTKVIRPEQRAAMKDPAFRRYYDTTSLPELDDLPHGKILGFVNLHSSDVITGEDLEDVTEEEKLYGWWEIGRYAWRLRHPEALPHPVIVRGQQGVWDYRGPFHVRDHDHPRQERPADIRRHLQLA